MQQLKTKELPWIMLVLAAVITGVSVWANFRSPSNQAIAVNPPEALTLSDLLTVAKDEANRIIGIAPTDTECGIAPDPVDCFIDRLEKENNKVLADSLIRRQALIEARRQHGELSN